MLAFLIAPGNQFGQRHIAFLIARQHGQAKWRCRLIGIKNQHVGADQGLDAGTLRGFVEFNQREQIALFGNCGGRHCILSQLLY